MASLIPGFEYDIFISYRQKDNKYDGWVSSFVDNLKRELEATFKEEVSVYFDINPHDGLLETHDVNASLKEKLKCLIFIPIISRTYCDPKSFAWEHEFIAFVEQASKEPFGLKVKLPNGNVASRVLPVRIHDLDNDDIKLCESVLGTVLRGVEFIYKEPGVSRPLTPDDDEKKNLGETKYRNQINKIALAIKEVISGLKAEPSSLLNEKTQKKEPFKSVSDGKKMLDQSNPLKKAKINLFAGAGILAIFILGAILTYAGILKRNTLKNLISSDGRISVAVMPFQNMTNDSTWNIWQNGLQNDFITSITNNAPDLKVRQAESVLGVLQSKGLTNYASIIPSVASAVSKQLDASVFIYGTIKKEGDILRLSAQLIDSKTEETYKSFQVDGSAGNIMNLNDSLSVMVKNYLIISVLQKKAARDLQPYVSTSSPEAYKYYILGEEAFKKFDYSTALEMYSLSIKSDSAFAAPIVFIAAAYGNLGMYEKAKEFFEKADGIKERMTYQQQLFAKFTFAVYFENPNIAIKYGRQLLETDDQSPLLYYNIGAMYIFLEQYDNAIRELEKVLEIYNKWDSKPGWSYHYTALGEAYHKTGQYIKEKQLYDKAEKDFPNDPVVLYRKAVLSLSEGENSAIEQIEKFKSICKNTYQVTDGQLSSLQAGIYREADLPDDAEKWFIEALRLEPQNSDIMDLFAQFLIDTDRDISRGIRFADEALKIKPDYFTYLDTKGWGLFKQANYEEAYKFIVKADSLQPAYSLRISQHLEEVKKVRSKQENI